MTNKPPEPSSEDKPPFSINQYGKFYFTEGSTRMDVEIYMVNPSKTLIAPPRGYDPTGKYFPVVAYFESNDDTHTLIFKIEKRQYVLIEVFWELWNCEKGRIQHFNGEIKEVESE